MKKISLFFISLLALTGFKSTLAQTEYGQGTLIVSPSVDEKYTKYLNLVEPLAFAISTDGQTSSGAFCQKAGTCKDVNGPRIALEQCNAASTSGAPCKLFAIKRDIIWHGRINLKSDVGTGPMSLSVAAEQKFQKYLGLEEPLAFAVSTDGARSSGSFCQKPGTCEDIDGPGLALKQCHSTGGPKALPCKIFAIGKDIVWDGSVTLAEPAKDQNLQNILTPPKLSPPPGQPVIAKPVAQPTAQPAAQPAKAPTPSTPARVRSSKAFRDLEEDIRRARPAAQ